MTVKINCEFNNLGAWCKCKKVKRKWYELGEKLVKQLIALNKQKEELRAKIDVFDYEERINHAKSYLGKYYREKVDHVSYAHVYDVDEKTCQTKTIKIHCFDERSNEIDGPTEYFSIDYNPHFDLQRWEEEGKYEEVTKEQFDKQYLKIAKHIAEKLKLNEEKN